MKKRCLALLLALVQCFSLLILPANAEETEKPVHFTMAAPAEAAAEAPAPVPAEAPAEEAAE